jgi:hypothetical protein
MIDIKDIKLAATQMFDELGYVEVRHDQSIYYIRVCKDYLGSVFFDFKRSGYTNTEQDIIVIEFEVLWNSVVYDIDVTDTNLLITMDLHNAIGMAMTELTAEYVGEDAE